MTDRLEWRLPQVQSSEVHFPYLQVLTQGSGNIAEYSGPHSHKFVSALKNNWKAITQRVRPQNVSHPRLPHNRQSLHRR